MSGCREVTQTHTRCALPSAGVLGGTLPASSPTAGLREPPSCPRSLTRGAPCGRAASCGWMFSAKSREGNLQVLNLEQRPERAGNSTKYYLFFVFILGNSCSAAHEVPGPGFEDETTPDPLTHCTRPGIEPAPRQRRLEPPASGSLSPLHRGRKSSCSFLHQGKPGLTQETLLTEHSGQADTTTFPVTDLKQQSGMQGSWP